MEENKYRREVTLRHKFFKTQTHYINFYKKVITNYKHSVLTEPNLNLFAWILANENKFKRYGIDIPVGKINFDLKNNNFIFLDNVEKHLTSLRKLKLGKLSLHKCSEDLRKDFPVSDEIEHRNLLDKRDYNKKFIELYDFLNKRMGLYFLFDINKKLIYIGKSVNLGSRILTSMSERKAFYCRYLITDTVSDLNILEPYYITKMKPILNNEFSTLDLPTIKIRHNYKISILTKIFRDD